MRIALKGVSLIGHDRRKASVSPIHPGRINTPYNAHAGNDMPMQPVRRAMRSPSEAAADAILHLLRYPAYPKAEGQVPARVRRPLSSQR